MLQSMILFWFLHVHTSLKMKLKRLEFPIMRRTLLIILRTCCYRHQKSCPRHFILCVNSMVPMWRNNVMIRLISVSLHVWENGKSWSDRWLSLWGCMLCRGEKGHWSAPWWGGKYALPYSATILPVSNTLFIVLHRRKLSDVRCVSNLSKHWNIWTDHHQLGFWRASWKRTGDKISGACCHIVIG